MATVDSGESSAVVMMALVVIAAATITIDMPTKKMRRDEAT